MGGLGGGISIAFSSFLDRIDGWHSTAACAGLLWYLYCILFWIWRMGGHE